MTKTILTVDDAQTIRKMVKISLHPTRHDVVEASDGIEALEIIRSQNVDLVITDLNMPNMNGIELTRQIRTLSEHVRTPIVLLTTESDPAKEMLGRTAGATTWLVKPFRQSQLLSIIAETLPN